jgi:hypothetical protein
MLGMAMCALLALGGEAVAADKEGLGIGRGIDHVGLLVRLENFAAATDVFTRQLGFSATPVLTSPAGVENRIIWFEDLSTQLPLPIFRFRGRDRFLIPASLAHGVLIEMVEPRR